MTNEGYIYIMVNPSYEGLVKIGKTTKEPEDRAKELSSPTGVATPFIVVYKRLFKNCHSTEKLIHAILSEKGYRINDSREFFNINITDAINLLISIQDNENDSISYDNNDNDNIENLGEIYYNKGLYYLYGRNDTFQDIDLALSYFEKSLSLGYIDSYQKLGAIWKYEKNNESKAIRIFHEGAENGNYYCYAELGQIYMNIDNNNPNNANLAWKKYFEYVESNPSQIDNIGWDYIAYFIQYSLLFNQFINPKFELFFQKYRENIIICIKEKIEYYKESNKTDYIKYLEKSISYLNELDEKILLSENNPTILSKNLYHIASQYLFGDNSYDKNEIKALNYYKKSLNLGYIYANIEIGYIWIQKGQLKKADDAWKDFYNNVFDRISNSTQIIEPIEKTELIKGFFSMFYYALTNNCTHLIHQYYILASINLGIIDFYNHKLDILQNKNQTDPHYTLIEEIEVPSIKYLETKNEIMKIKFVHEYIKEQTQTIQNEIRNNGTINVMIYKL